MTYLNSNSGLNNVAEYMASGLPWVTASIATTTPTQFDFPYVTSNLTITNISGSENLRIGFTLNGVNGSNYHSISPGETLSFDYRIKTLFVRSAAGSEGFCLSAGLTTISTRSFPTLTGSFSITENDGTPRNDFGYSTGLG